MKKVLLLAGVLIGLWGKVNAQKVLLYQDVTSSTEKQTFGPNLKYFGHFYGGFGLVASSSEKGSEVEYPASHEFLLGYRYKYKIAKFYALGWDLSLQSQTFKLKQHEGKTLPNPILHNEEKYRFTSLSLGIYNRFNFGRRGNHIGNFLDLGVYGSWVPFKTHLYKDDQLFGLIGPLDGVKEVKVRETGLKYVADTNYGVQARLGFNRYVLYGTYRLSDLFEAGYGVGNGNGGIKTYAELPRLTVGFQIGVH